MVNLNVRIEKSEWFKDIFAMAFELTDVLRQPVLNVKLLSIQDQNDIKQTQVEANEIVQVLGENNDFYLIQKWDDVIGWIPMKSVKLNNAIKSFNPPTSKMISTEVFFNTWKGTVYQWGGISLQGVDCSGFSQKYYLDVLNIKLPKNSKNQRKMGMPISIKEIKDHDLIFCHSKGGSGIHHVGIHFSGKVLHSQLVRGVVSDSLEDFIPKYYIEEVIRISK